ncbi:MAG: four-carbon acid sugar kinase family protein, partial [Spirosomataceae bacterium]
MVVVIADDFTGAAEMAGIALTKQFSVEIVTSLPLKTEASVVVISTDTRSLPEEEA